MKNMNSFFTAVLCMALIGVIFTAELLYCAHSTLMSPSHFSRMLETDAKLSQLTTLVYNGLSPSESEKDEQAAINRYAVNMLNKTDQAWVRSQIYIAATGLHKYICSQAVTLPTLDLVPFKNIIIANVALEMMKYPQAQEKIEKVKTILSVLNNKYFSAIINFGLNNQLVTMLLELAPIRNTGLDSSTIMEIIRIYLTFSNKNTTLDQASYSIVRQMSMEALELDKLKDYFDMNVFLEKAFGTVHPISSFKTVVNKIDTSMTLSVKVLFWCFILLIFIIFRFSPVRLLITVLYCSIIASALNLLLSALLINPSSSQRLAAQFISSQGSLGRFLVKLWVFLFRDFGFYLALQSALAGTFAALVYLGVKFIFRKAKKTKPKIHVIPTWRLIVVIVIFTLLFSWWNISAITREIRIFRSDIHKLKDTDINQSIMEGLKEAGGMNFLRYLQK